MGGTPGKHDIYIVKGHTNRCDWIQKKGVFSSHGPMDSDSERKTHRKTPRTLEGMDHPKKTQSVQDSSWLDHMSFFLEGYPYLRKHDLHSSLTESPKLDQLIN